MDLAAIALAGGGALVVLGTVIGYLLVANRADRAQYDILVDRFEARAETAETREALVQKRLDEERALRRQAEDEADKLRRQLGAQGQ